MSGSKKNQKKSPVVAVLNMKGGVGKTTIAANLFHSINKKTPSSTLLIDLDAQFNLTQLLTPADFYEQMKEEERTAFYVFQHDTPDSVFAVSDEYHSNLKSMEDYLVSFEESMDVLLGDFRLALLNLRNPLDLTLPRKRFKNFINQAKNSYGLIVLDCNPSTSFLTQCALQVATHLLIPVRPDKFSLRGVEMVHQFVNEYLGPNWPIKTSILVNETTQNIRNKDAINELRSSKFGLDMLSGELRYSQILRADTDYTGFAIEKGGPWSYDLKSHLREIASEYADILELT